MPDTPTKTKEQVLAQCSVVEHLAIQIAIVHHQKAEAYAQMEMDAGLIDVVGQLSASIMETMGNVLNNMDAVDEDEDSWVNPIFEAAHALWPVKEHTMPDTPTPTTHYLTAASTDLRNALRQIEAILCAIITGRPEETIRFMSQGVLKSIAQADGHSKMVAGDE